MSSEKKMSKEYQDIIDEKEKNILKLKQEVEEIKEKQKIKVGDWIKCKVNYPDLSLNKIYQCLEIDEYNCLYGDARYYSYSGIIIFNDKRKKISLHKNNFEKVNQNKF